MKPEYVVKIVESDHVTLYSIKAEHLETVIETRGAYSRWCEFRVLATKLTEDAPIDLYWDISFPWSDFNTKDWIKVLEQ